MTTRSDPDRMISAWLHDEAPDHAPNEIVGEARAQIASTNQRRSPWPVRRYSEMGTYGRLLAAAAAVVALAVAGTAFMLAGGFSPKASAEPVATSSPGPPGTPVVTLEASAAAVLPEFTACVPTNAPARTGTTETEVIPGPNGDVTVERLLGFTWKGAITATDPRFSGTHYFTASNIKYLVPPSEEGPELATAGHRIENDEGAWQGWGSSANLADGTPDASGPVFLTGEGAYDGLTAVLLEMDGSCLFNLRIVVTEVPDPPVSYTSE